MSVPAPVHISQLDGSPWAGQGCMGAVGAMALNAYSRGALTPSMHAIRAAQDDKAGGIGLDDVATAWRRGWGQTFSHGIRAWSTVRARLATADGAAITVRYGALGRYRAPGSDFTGGHALWLQRLAIATGPELRGTSVPGIVVNDPLRSGPVVIPEAVVLAAYTGGAGWGAGTYASSGSSTGDGSAADRSLAFLRSAGISTDPAHVLTRAEAERIATDGYKLAPGTPLWTMTADRLTGQTVATWTAGAASGATGPLKELGALGDLVSGAIGRGVVLAAIAAVALLGLFLTFREPLTVVLPSPARRLVR